jgi:hypothetical protein
MSQFFIANTAAIQAFVKNIAVNIAKAVFHPDFAGSVALPEIINKSKQCFHKNVFLPLLRF